MNKRFTTYEELVKEKQYLHLQIQAKKQVINNDIQEIKAQLQPARDAIEFVKKITSKDKSSILLNIGSDLAINTIVKRLILSRTGWLTKLVIPYLLKNYSSHFLAEQKDKWFNKLSSWLGHKNGKEPVKEREKWNEAEGYTDRPE